MAKDVASKAPLFEDIFFYFFDKNIYSSMRFNISFILLIGLEIGFIVFSIPLFIHSAFLSFVIAGLVLTVFGYFLWRQYHDSQKLMHFKGLLDNVLNEVKKNSSNNESSIEHHVEIAKVCCRLADRLYQREYGYYRLPINYAWVITGLERLSCLLHWREVYMMRELLLKQAIDEYLEFVRQEPTNLEAHALLSNAYVMLSGLYIDPEKIFPSGELDRWIPKERKSVEMEKKFKITLQSAIEEFKILNEYAPSDPWVYTQLAYSYRDLRMPKEEQLAYESILTLRPQDHEIRFKLGSLYFQQGENAKGLKIYEELKKVHYGKAHELITEYGKHAQKSCTNE